MGIKEIPPSHCMRKNYMERIESLIKKEFSDDDLYQKEFLEALLLSMQSICGTEETAKIIRGSQIHQ